jgi:GNAT superfamily N-acetyltransferase
LKNPNLIKLADGTNTTFDSSNPDIRYEDGGTTKKERFNNISSNSNVKIFEKRIGRRYQVEFYLKCGEYKNGKAILKNETLFNPYEKISSEDRRWHEEKLGVKKDILRVFELRSLWIDKECRGKGIASQLIEAIIEWAKKNKILWIVSYIKLSDETNLTNEQAYEFLLRHGFKLLESKYSNKVVGIDIRKYKYSKGGSIVYSAIFFDENEIVKRYGQVHPNLYSHHSTIEFKPQSIGDLPIGDRVKISIVGRLTTDKVDVLLVNNPFSKNKYPHITLSTSEGVKPFESNKQIEQNIDKVEPLNDYLEGVVGYFDGSGDITKYDEGGEVDYYGYYDDNYYDYEPPSYSIVNKIVKGAIKLNEDERYILSGESKIDFHNKTQGKYEPGELVSNWDIKPKGLWYSLGDSWANYVFYSYPQRSSEYCCLHKIEVSDKVLRLDTIEKCYQFTDKYGFTIHNPYFVNDPNIAWDRVALDYSGIEITKPHEWSRISDSRKLFWMYGWDVPSGCIWNQDGIKSIKLLYSEGDDAIDENKFAKGGEVDEELSVYLQNIRPDPLYGEGWYKANFGRNGGITWEIPESQRELESPKYLIVQSMDRNKDVGVANKEDSKGEGAKAIASLFLKYSNLKEILYDDYSEGFWQKIGGSGDVLKREDFFKYFNQKNKTNYFNKGGKIKSITDVDDIEDYVPIFIDENVPTIPEDPFELYEKMEDYLGLKIVKSLLKKSNIPIKVLGAVGKGYDGVAFETDNRTILKVTKNGEEAMNSFLVLKNYDNLEGQAKIHNLFIISNGTQKLYFIEKDKLRVAANEMSNFPLDYYDELWRVGQKEDEKDFEYWVKDLAKDWESENNQSVSSQEMKQAFDIVDLSHRIVKDMDVYDLEVNDATPHNVGYFDDDLYCFDCAASNDKILARGGNMQYAQGGHIEFEYLREAEREEVEDFFDGEPNEIARWSEGKGRGITPHAIYNLGTVYLLERDDYGFDTYESTKYYFVSINESFAKGGGVDKFTDRFGKNKFVKLDKKDIDDFAPSLLDLIKTAYEHIGGHFEFSNVDEFKKTNLDYWVATDVDDDPDADALIGGKNTQAGTKITVGGQDGSKVGKIALIRKIKELLEEKGFYTEMDKELAEKIGVEPIKSLRTIKKVLGKDDIEYIGKGLYSRNISGHKKKKVLVGIPKKFAKGGEVNQYFRAEVGDDFQKQKTFIPNGYYEMVGKDGNPVIKYDEYAMSNVPEVAASKTIYGAILGASSMLKFGKGITKNTPIQIYTIQEKPDVDISHWGGADFEYLDEVRYRKNVLGKYLLEYRLDDDAYKLVKDFYDYKAFESLSKYDDQLEFDDSLDYIYEMISDGTFFQKFKKLIDKSLSKKTYLKGGEVDEQVIKERWAKKKDSLMNMADNIRSLRTNLRKDLKGDDEKDRLTALAISLMDKTAERVGNDESESNGHLGITGLSKRNVKVEGNTITLKYIGKSGVKQEKQFSDEGIASALRDAISNSQSKYVFETSDGFRIKNDRINRYLSEYDISAKDLRGYSANQWIVSKLREVKDKEILGDEAKRKKKFNEIVKSVAEKVGHGAPTLKKHYMLPSLEREWVNNGKIVDLSNIKRAFEDGGEIDKYKQGGVTTIPNIESSLQTFYINHKLNYPYNDMALVNKMLKSLSKDIKVVKYLGGGSNGSAYLTSDKKVLKIGYNEQEAYSSFVIFKNPQDFTTQAKVHDLFVINNLTKTEIKEEKSSRGFVDVTFRVKHDKTYFILKDFINVLSLDELEEDVAEFAIKGYARKYKFEEAVKQAIEIVEDAYVEDIKLSNKEIEKLKSFMKPYYDFGKKLEIEGKKYGLEFGDTESTNMGFDSNDNLVCFDCLSESKYMLKKGGGVGVANINQGASVVNNIDYDHLDESQDLPNDGEGIFAKGGDLKFNDIVLYHEKEGNWFVAKNTVYAWLYQDPNAAKKLESGEFDFVLFPPNPPMSMAMSRGYVPPLLKIWTKKYQKETKGADNLLGIVKGWYDEENKKLYIIMMTTRKDMRRKGVNSHIIKNLREEFKLDKEQIVFDKPTKEGEMFAKSDKYDDGGNVYLLDVDENIEYAKGGDVETIEVEQSDKNNIVLTYGEKGYLNLERIPYSSFKVGDYADKDGVINELSKYGVEKGEKVWSIASIIVAPKYRGQGVASILMNAAIQWAKQNNYKKLVLLVQAQGKSGLTNEQLKEFYSRYKFKELKKTYGMDWMARKLAKGGEVITYSTKTNEYYDRENKKWVIEPFTIKKGQLIEYSHSDGGRVEARFLAKAGEKKAKIEILHGYSPWTKRVESTQYVNPAGRTEPAYFLKDIPRGTIKTVSIDFIEPVTEKTFELRAKPISMWLKSPEFKEAFGHLDNPTTMAKGGENKLMDKYAFVDKDMDASKIAKKLQNTKSNEKANELEREIYDYLKDWTDDTDAVSAHNLYANKKIFQKLKEQYPKIFKAEKNKLVYRGLDRLNVDTLLELYDKFSLKDIKKIDFPRLVYYLYSKPIKYKPENDAQSWTTDIEVANGFSRGIILVTKTDDNFIMNPEVTNKIGDSLEDEVIHLGKNYGKVYVMFFNFDELEQFAIEKSKIYDSKKLKSMLAKGGDISDEDKKETYKKWKSLVNMSKSELEKFYNSEEGKVAGLTASQAKSQGIDSGRESARWIMKMKDTSVKDWTPTMWKWAKKQISFVSRMSGNKGQLYDEKGNKTRKHTSLLIWGHNPKKKAGGGELDIPLKENAMNEITYNQLPAIDELPIGKRFVLKEHYYNNQNGKPTHQGCRYLIVENMGDAQMSDCLKLKVHGCYGGGGVTTKGIITRPIKNIMNKGRDMGESLTSGLEKAYKKGGELDPDKKEVKEYFEHKSGAAGGLLVGKRHSEGGIQAINKSTGQPLEMEGGEVVITRDAVSDSTLHDFNGKQMTNREILSAINESGGGVKFADGGDVSCKCSGKEYKLGGKTYKDYELFNKINNSYGSKAAIEKGMKVEDKEHGETFKMLKNGEITYDQFLKKLVVDHLSENPKYYDK